MTSPALAPTAPLVHTLYREHHSWLLHWLQRRMSADAAAADVAQDTFLRLLQKPDLPPLQEPRAYLTRIADGLVINLWRRRALERAYLEVLAALPDHTAPSEEQRHLVLESLVRIDRLLDGLPARTREVFLLAQLDGMPYPQIAQRMRVNVRTVKRDMVRALAVCLEGLC